MEKTNIVFDRLKKLARDERGNMVEYIILIGVIALLCLAAFKTFGGSVKDKIEEQAGTVSSVNGLETTGE